MNASNLYVILVILLGLQFCIWFIHLQNIEEYISSTHYAAEMPKTFFVDAIKPIVGKAYSLTEPIEDVGQLLKQKLDAALPAKEVYKFNVVRSEVISKTTSGNVAIMQVRYSLHRNTKAYGASFVIDFITTGKVTKILKAKVVDLVFEDVVSFEGAPEDVFNEEYDQPS